MENTKQLILPQARSFGEKISDSLMFIRLNLGVLLKAHFWVTLPVIILTAVIFVLAFRDYFSLLQTIESGPFADSIVTRNNFARFFVFSCFAYLASIPVTIVTLTVLDAYQKGDDEKAAFPVVMATLKKNFFKLYLLRLVVSPLVFLLGMLLFLPMGPELNMLSVMLAIILFFPGLIFYNIFLCADLLVLQHDFSIGQALKRSTSIMSRNLWTSLLSSGGSLLLYFVFGMMMLIPLELLELIKGMTSGYVDPGSVWGIFLITLRGFNILLSYVLYSFPVSVAGIEYFTIRETNSRASIMERIRQIGVVETKRNVYAEDEQY